MGTSGLGPTKLISPFKTLNSCGNSSNLVFLKICPIPVILLSFPTVICLLPSLFSLIVLNLYILNNLPFLVTLTCLNSTGPLEVSFIKILTITIKGNSITIPQKEATISNNLFKNILFSYLVIFNLFIRHYQLFHYLFYMLYIWVMYALFKFCKGLSNIYISILYLSYKYLFIICLYC